MNSDWGRIYFLNASSTCSQGCHFCAAMGCLSAVERTDADIQRSLNKAKLSGYQSVLISCSEVLTAQLFELIDKIQNLNLRPVVQIQTAQLSKFLEIIQQLSPQKLAILQQHVSVLLVASSMREGDLSHMQTLRPHFQSVYLQILLLNTFEPVQILKNIKKYRAQLFDHVVFRAPQLMSPQGGRSNVRFLHKLVKRLLIELNQTDLPVLAGLDAYNPFVDPESELESLAQAECMTSFNNGGSIKISVVIPTYNNKPYLLCTVRHLLAQTLNPAEFEIIVVDDGSDDGTQAALKEELNVQTVSLPTIQYFYFQRKQQRRMGDFQFRAGVARNQGVRFARGEYLLFLDSDIVTSPDFLQDTLDKHKNHDVVQAVRLHLKPEASHGRTSIHSINDSTDLVSVDDGYWDAFHQTQNWDFLKDKWKYACTYALSMPRALFYRVGWFRKNYCVYGYEDTDLGYRLAKVGARFYLNPIKTYHLHHLTSRSEFQNSFFQKKLLLRHSALIFYLNTLSDEVHSHLEWVLKPHLKLRLYVYEFLLMSYHYWQRVPGSQVVEKYLQNLIRSFHIKRILLFVFYPLRKLFWFLEYQISERFLSPRKSLRGGS
jgi:glycosyltransferase involved in cell wall biosynthesis